MFRVASMAFDVCVCASHLLGGSSSVLDCFSLSQLVYFFVVSEFVSMDIFNLMVRIYLIATICLSCFCRLISACLSRCIYSDFFLADILLSVVSPPTRIFSRLPYIFW